jgi:hypothetical protein
MEDKLVDGRCLRLIIDWKIHYPGTNDKLIDRDITQETRDELDSDLFQALPN